MLMIALCLSVPAMAITIFSDNFDSEHEGVGKRNYTRLTNWQVPAGVAVDLIPLANGKDNWLPETGHGLFIELVGSGPIGLMKLKKPLWLQPGTYLLEFDLAGSQQSRSKKNMVDIILGNSGKSFFAAQISLNYQDPWTHYHNEFEVSKPTRVNIYLVGKGINHKGLLFDNLNLTLVQTPFPPTLAQCGIGLLLMILMGRRLRRH
jgi:hypothetical protein